jgi:hypothetical protein
MAFTAKPLIQGATIGATVASYYTAPSGTTTRITQFSLTNTDTVNRTVSVYISASPSTPGTVDLIVKEKTIAVNETWVPYPALGVTMASNGSIQLIADVAGVVVAKASGVEIS